MFVDLAGFTGLTERFAAAGPEGAEQLRALLDSHFDTVLRTVDAWGGEVAAFAGDAMLVTFLASHHGGTVEAVRAAVSCARAVQGAPDRSTLRQRVSVSSGEVLTWALNGEGGTSIGVLGGDAVARLALPHSLAEPGEVLLSPDAHLASRAIGVVRAGGVVCVHAAGEAFEATPPARRTDALLVVDPAQLRAWIPRVVAEREEAGQVQWVGEFRSTTVLFSAINAPIESRSDPAALQAEVSRQLAALARFDGDCLGVVIDEKGATMIGAFGLPGRAHGDDAVRAVRAAMALQTRGAPTPVGVATGRLYVGLLGGALRRDYGGLGPPMNLAARLLGKADGSVLLDAATMRALGGRVATADAGRVRVKGWPNPVPVFRPTGEARAQRSANRAILGRDAERTRLLRALDTAPGGLRARIVGEPGIGKSALIGSIATAARSRGMRVVIGEGGAIERTTPWHAWKPVVASLVAGKRLVEVLAWLGDELAPRAPLLDGIWPFAMQPTPLTTDMGSAARASSIRDLIIRLLERAAEQGRVLLVLDDIHWLDTNSATLVRDVLTRVPHVDVILGSRPLGDDASTELTRLVRLAGLDDVTLGAMTEEEIGSLVSRALGGATVPPALVALIVERAGGHPFYSEQLVLALRQTGVVRVVAGACEVDVERARSTLPVNVEGVVIARIDAMPPGAQLAAKVASVVGRIFPERTVAGIYPVDCDAQQLPSWLSELGRNELIIPESAGTEPSWAFKHAITQEVAYNLLLFAQRRELHRRTAAWYQQVAIGEPPWPVLAWHWERAGEAAEAIDALERAAESALAQHANAEVASFLERAIALDEGMLPRVSPERRAHWEWMLGSARLKLVSLPKATGHFRAALGHLGTPAPTATPMLLFGLVLACVRQAWHLGFGSAPHKAPAARNFARASALAYQGLSEAAYFSLDLIGLLHATVQSINFAERAGEPVEIALAYGTGAISAGLGGLHQLGWRWFRQAEEAAERSGHLSTIAYVNLLRSIFANGLGAWAAASEANRRSSEVFLRLGDNFRAASSLCSEGIQRIQRGRLDEAAGLIRQAKSIAPRDGAIQVRVWCAASEMWTASFAGAPLDRWAKELEGLCSENPDHAERILALGALAEARRRGGDLTGAVRAALEVNRLSLIGAPTNWSNTWPLMHTVDALIAGWKAGLVPANEVERAIGTLSTYARMVPAAVPRAYQARATWAVALGKTRRAQALWTRMLARAKELELPIEMAVAAEALGLSGADAQSEAISVAARRARAS